jgi:prevent-host-death family protein
MKEVAVSEAKARLSKLLPEVERGEQVTITRRGGGRVRDLTADGRD